MSEGIAATLLDEGGHGHENPGGPQTNVRFETEHGPVYLRLSRSDPYPESFERVDADGRGLGRAR